MTLVPCPDCGHGMEAQLIRVKLETRETEIGIQLYCEKCDAIKFKHFFSDDLKGQNVPFSVGVLR